MDNNNNKTGNTIDPKSQDTTEQRIKNDKARVIEAAKSTLSITSVAAKTGVGRSTIYTWENNDPEFKSQLEEALLFKLESVRDVALIKFHNYMVNTESDNDWRAQLSLIRYTELRIARIKKGQQSSGVDEDLDSQTIEALGELLIAASKKVKDNGL